MSKLRLYIDTALHLKPSQIAYRIWRKLGGSTRLHVGYRPCPDADKADIRRVPALSEIDFDPVFLARFDVDALLDDRVELLNHEERMDWRESWHAELSTPLWRFNLHYHEYLLPLAKAFLDEGDKRYLDKAKAIVDSWIDACPRERGGVAWDPYVISMRIVSWLAFRAELDGALRVDNAFCERINASLVEQYVHLSQHLEKDLLANHYLENLKALAILACYFDDRKTLELVLPMLKAQVDEQVLDDGMHFEQSPMYQKIVLEDLMRAAIVLRDSGFGEHAKAFKLRQMCDCLYSMERGINRTPLFNDCGDNVAKSRDALLLCARERFGVVPEFHGVLKNSGYCILERQTKAGLVKVIFDAGKPGPAYAMGHVHCDALSFECFVDGEPWIVNCGTYAYQDAKRLEFKKTQAHSGVMIDGVEQHECWAPFRVARYSTCKIEFSDGISARGSMKLRGRNPRIVRDICLADNGVRIIDKAFGGKRLEGSFIFAFGLPNIAEQSIDVNYSPEFGLLGSARKVIVDASDGLVIPYPMFYERAEHR